MRGSTILIVLLLFSIQGFSQTQKDSTKTSASKKALEEGIKLITRSNRDSSILLENNIEQFIPYADMIIRNIYVQSIGFEKSIYGNEKPSTQRAIKTANALHKNTREKTIRQHLFVHPNDRLNPYKLGDNERFLRERNFILDSRFVVSPIGDSDSVDITVVTRDVFSIGFTGGGSFPKAPRLGVYEGNLDGRGQRVEFTMLIDQDRNPKTGYSLSLIKSSFLGTFADLEFFFTQLNTGLSFGDEIEFATGVLVDRPLVSPYSRLAGGAQVSKNWSQNVYTRPDSAFLDYSYDVIDLWVGYNFGAKKKFQDRNRAFLATRAFNGYYTNRPSLENVPSRRVYNNLAGILSSLTFYKRNFFKTQYVLGFGRTEDVPYGYSFTATTGVVKELRIQRPYAGIALEYSGNFKAGGFYSLNLNTGGYLNNSNIEDAVVFSTLSLFTRAFPISNFRLRNSITVGYAQLFNVFTSDWLQIQPFIIPGLRVLGLEAYNRNSIGVFSTLYTPWSVLGFRIAPLSELYWALMKCRTCEQRNNTFTAVSGGLRIRNENLIFGTVEIKATYISNDEFGNSKFSFSLKQNLRFRRTDNFVTAPSLVRYNFIN